jgi:Pregnancy-associated plasma protein-A/Secretion system C-terminal sorting domain/Fibronectin type III domain
LFSYQSKILIMNRNFLLLPALVLFSANILFAQQRQCGAMEVLARQIEENPAQRLSMDVIEQHTNHFIQNNGAQDRAVITIPVVVHVVYNTAAQNVSDTQIQSQLDVLNADFRKLNADVSGVPAGFTGLAADAEINFCLAKQDPAGLATSGIERRQTTATSFTTNDNVKKYINGGLAAWDASKYLNLWVCNLSGGVLGYAQFPGGAAATDGVVCTFTGFGTMGSAVAPFNKGRTATHEVGHWLNLFHIWGDDGTGCTGSDNCADTPNQADENYGCPVFPQVSCSNGPNGDMFMNYMDYTDDACMFMFTTGQKARMQALFAAGGARASLATSPGCNAPSTATCGAVTGQNASAISATGATLGWTAVSGATSYNLRWKTSASSTYTNATGLTTNSYALSGLTASTSYDFGIQAICGATSGVFAGNTTFISAGAGGGGGNCAEQYEPNNTRNTAYANTPIGTEFTAQIASATDVDWYKFANTSALRRIKVDLTTLPLDYDLKLYRSSTVVGTSQNTGTTDEVIILNTTTVSNAYSAYVYGYNGIFSSTLCYSLKVTLSATNFRSDGSTDGATEELELPVVFENAGFGLFPNPATERVNVEIPMSNEADVQVNLIDPAGKLLISSNKTLTKTNNRVELDLSNLTTGVYFVQVRNGEMVKTRKLVVQK